ncbi:MAG: NRDE family protein [Planctomycetota bacterium]
MCTATLITLDSSPPSLRLVTNRDELHTRPQADPPEVRVFGDYRALLPIDPQSDGTWIAVNEAGLVITLLNLNPRLTPPPRPGLQSRGGVVPSLMGCSTVMQAIEIAKDLPTDTMMPFRLLLADRDRLATVRADGESVSVEILPLSATPVMLTSSGLGDHIVEGPRRKLFESDPPLDTESQDAFHRHSWPDRKHVSVAMCRDDARTISRTVVEIDSERVHMHYTAISMNGEEGVTNSLHLPLRVKAKG